MQEQKELMSVKEASQITGISERTIYRLVSKGEFPKPKKVGSRSLWRRHEILEWVKE